jgi:hypothetical protein
MGQRVAGRIAAPSERFETSVLKIVCFPGNSASG